ncbi:MAG: ABC transporter ATP-binding protein [Acidobacteriota bacterium]
MTTATQSVEETNPGQNADAGRPLIDIRGLSKTYLKGSEEVHALQNVDIHIRTGEFISLMGPSGSGKSTLLNILAGIDSPSDGEVILHIPDQESGQVYEVDLNAMSERQVADWRNQHVGFIFQHFNLIPVLTAFENVELPLLLTSLSRSERRQHVETALELVNLTDRAKHYPKELSGGQEQRVSIARAIVTDPTFILADEPTGDLDADSANQILEILSELNQQFGKTIIMVTHDPRAAKHASHKYFLDKGVMQKG